MSDARSHSMWFNVLNYSLFLFLIAAMLYPFNYIVMNSLSSGNNISTSSLYLIPNGFSLNTYRYLLQDGMIFTGYKNSILVTGLGTAISLSVTSMMAYPLSRSELPGKKLFLGLIMFTFIFHGGMIPTYLIVKSYGLVNTLWALMLPSAISIYNLLIMTRFFRNIPPSLFEAAAIDGRSEFSIFATIVLPLSKPVLAVITLFYAVSYWNAFLPGIIYLNDSSMHPIQVILYNFIRASLDVENQTLAGLSKESILMAIAFVSMLPIILLYPFLQRFFVSGIMLGSVKE